MKIKKAISRKYHKIVKQASRLLHFFKTNATMWQKEYVMKMTNNRKLTLTSILLAATTFLLVACGGGGGGGTPAPTTYTVGGSVSGLTSGSVTLQNNGGDTLVTGNGGFTFATALNKSVGYSVTVASAPSGQSCSVTSGSGAFPGSNVSNVSVSCVTSSNGGAAVLDASSTESSATATSKALRGRSVAKAFVINVTTPGTATLEVVGPAMSGGVKPVAEMWINTTDSTDLVQACSTNGTTKIPVTDASTTLVFTHTGTRVICFKTAALSGGYTNGTPIGLKLTAGATVLTNGSYTADSVSQNNVDHIKLIANPSADNVTPGETYHDHFGDLDVIPLDASNVFVNQFPKVCGLSQDTGYYTKGNAKNVKGYDFDFTNANGISNPKAEYFVKSGWDTSGEIFTNAQAKYEGTSLSFSGNCVEMGKVYLLNKSTLQIYTNLWNNGPSVSAGFYLDTTSITFEGSPEVQYYDYATNTRIW